MFMIKKNKSPYMMHVTTWINLYNNTREKETHKGHIEYVHFLRNIQKGQIHSRRKQTGDCLAWDQELGLITGWHKRFYCSDRNVLKLNCDNTHTNL